MRIDNATLARLSRFIGRDNAALGLVIHDRYEILRRIGRGGMGEIFAASDQRLNRSVAMKILSAGLSDPEWAARFEDEARTMGRIDHPGIVPIHDLGILPDGRLYYTMKLIDGPTFGELIGAGEDRRKMIGLLARAAEVVHVAHERGVVHRDLKPANLMVGKEGEVYILDWGIARVMEEFRAAGGDGATAGSGMTSAGTVLGTLQYMPPEQARGDLAAIDARSDVYSLGAILYEILTGLPPISGSTVTELLDAATRGKIAPPRKLDPSLPVDLEAICRKAVHREQRRRYASALDLARDLRRWLDGDAVRAHPPTLKYRAGKLVSKHRLLFASCSIAVAATLGLGLYWVLHRADRSTAEAKNVEDEVFGPIRKRLEQIAANPEGYRRGIQLLREGLSRAPDSWDAWMRLGEFQVKASRYADALDSFGKAASINPRLAMAHYQRGRVFMEHLEENARAILEFREALRLEPDNEHALVGQARIAMLEEDYPKAYKLCLQAEPIARHLHDYHFVRGNIHVESGTGSLCDPRKALACFSKAIELEPDFSPAWQGRSIAKSALGDLEGALADDTESVKRAPEDWRGHSNRCVARMALGDLDGAQADIEEALRLDPQQSHSYINRANLRIRLRHFDSAAADVERALSLRPDLAEAFLTRGDLKFRSGDLPGALRDQDRAIELKPRLPNAWTNRGEVHFRRRELDAAIADHSRAIELFPFQWESYTDRANARRGKGDWEGALADARRAVELNPRSGEALSNLASARIASGDLEGALSDCERAIKLDPRLPGPHVNRGAIRLARNDAEGAIADYTAALEADPRSAEAWANRSKVRFDRGEFPAALTDATQATEIDPLFSEAYSHRANARGALGDSEGALVDDNRAIELNPKYAVAYSNRAGLRINEGDSKGALEDFAKAIELQPSLPEPWGGRGFAREFLGDIPGAVGDWRKALELAPPGWRYRKIIEDALRRHSKN